MEWRPAETAPQDGAPILANLRFGDGEHGGVHVVHYNDGTWRLDAIGSIRLAESGDPDDDRFMTHWMPLPPLPGT